MADDRFAAGFDDAGADEQVLFTELRVIHTSRVRGEVGGLVADLLGQIGIGGLNPTKGSNEFGNLALVEPTFLVQPDPGITAFGVGGVE